MSSEWLLPSQIGKLVFDVFVGDLEQAIARYSRDYGLGPWRVSELVVDAPEFRGEAVEFGLRAAMLDLGPVNVELLQARGDAPVVRWFEGKGDGSSWHPVVYFERLELAEAARRTFASHGIEPVFSGRIAGSSYWVYDTLPFLGCRFEIAGGDLAGISYDDADVS